MNIQSHKVVKPQTDSTTQVNVDNLFEQHIVETSTAVEGVIIHVFRDCSVRARTIKFVNDNKEIFDELSKL